MKAKLIVVRGRPEGKEIQLTQPSFVIGRGANCHLRPNSEEISRRHLEFQLAEDHVKAIDLGSRNGTLVNGVKLSGEAAILKDGDLIQLGQLTFAIAIEGVVQAKPSPNGEAPSSRNLDVADNQDIESWLIGNSGELPPERASGVYEGQTMTIETNAMEQALAKVQQEVAETAAEMQREAEEKAKNETETDSEEASESLPEDDPYDYLTYRDDEDDEEEGDGTPKQGGETSSMMMDESNPFVAAAKAKTQTETEAVAEPATHKQSFEDTSQAAGDILKRMLERRRSESK